MVPLVIADHLLAVSMIANRPPEKLEPVAIVLHCAMWLFQPVVATSIQKHDSATNIPPFPEQNEAHVGDAEAE